MPFPLISTVALALRIVSLVGMVSLQACGGSATPVPVPTSSRHPVRSDLVLQWNEQTIATGGPQQQRTLAMVHAAVFEAVNAIAPRYAPFLTVPAPPANASADAAAAGAGYGVLVRLFPEQRQPLAAALSRSLASVADGPAESEGVRYGDRIAQAMYDARLGDRILLPEKRVVPDGRPGAYQLTADHEPPVNTRAPEWVPFALASVSQFRPGGPPALISRDYARDLNEVREIGRMNRPSRTRDEAEIPRWHLETAMVQLNRIARAEAARDGRDLVDHARLFALLNIVIADASTAVFDAKYAYTFWRPVTAIRKAADDGNVATEPDVVWSSLLPAPPHPEYPSAHAAIQFAGARVLTAYFGPSHPFETTSRSVPGVTRHYESFEAFAKEGGDSRILAGIHFRTSINDGRIMGQRIADWVLEHCLKEK